MGKVKEEFVGPGPDDPGLPGPLGPAGIHKVVVFTAGIWDLFHCGHLRLLKRAKALGDVLIVGVATDRLAEEYKRKPIIPLEQRMEIIEGIRYVDAVVSYDSLDVTNLLKNLDVDVMVVGEDWGGFPEQNKYKVYLEQNNKKLVKIPYTQGISTTAIRERVIEEAVIWQNDNA